MTDFTHITAGIRCIRPTWARNESFFLAEEFVQLVDRCEAMHFSFYGVEVFTPWGELLSVAFNPEAADLQWVRILLEQWPQPGTLYSGTLYCMDDEQFVENDSTSFSDQLEALLESFDSMPPKPTQAS
jgi:hypothetical protein